MKNKFESDFNAQCRLCLQKAHKLRPIFDGDVNFSYRIKLCVGLEFHQCDPGPTHICVDCLSQLENWEKFREMCIIANKCFQEQLKKIEENRLNLNNDQAKNLQDNQEAEEHDDNYDSTFDNKLNTQDSDNDSFRLKSKSPISITARKAYPRAVKLDGKVLSKMTNVKTSNRKKRYECGICSIVVTEKESLYNHLTDNHCLEENSTPHYCLICNKGYCSFKIYQDHLTAEQDIHGTTQIQDRIKDCTIGCGLCSCKFSRSTSLYRHLRNHALKNDLVPYLCSFCKVGFLDKYSLYLHASNEHQAVSITYQEPNEECSERLVRTDDNDLCAFGGGGGGGDLAITTKRSVKKLRTAEDKRAKYREHYRRFQSKTYACEFCDVTYTRFCDLSNHDRTAHDDMAKEHSCPTCGKLFLTAGRLQVHRDAFHADKPFGCDVCNVRCKSKHTLRTHMRKHSGAFACQYCGLTAASNAALVSHVRVHTGEKPFVCDMCGNAYASKLGLTSHKRTHRHEALFRCDVCGYTGSSHSSIYIHRQTHSADKPFVCDVCGKTFKIKVRLVDHQKIHFAARKYACEVCDKAFLARYQLAQHSRTHSGEKPYQCHLCSKSFARRDGLSEHVRTHTGEKRYTCSECFSTFSFYKTMKNHKCVAKRGGGGGSVEVARPTARDDRPTTARDDRPTTARDDRPTTTRDDRPTTARDDRPTTARDDRPTTARDYRPSALPSPPAAVSLPSPPAAVGLSSPPAAENPVIEVDVVGSPSPVLVAAVWQPCSSWRKEND